MSKSKAKKKKKNKSIKEEVTINKKQLKSLNKYYTIAQVMLAVTPFISLAYISMEAGRVGLPMQEVVQTNTKLTVMFLISMINPFIAYLLNFVQKKIESGDAKYAVTNIVMFIVAEVLLQNVFYIILFVFLLYKTLKVFNITIRQSFEEKIKDGFLMTISGSLVVMFLAGICLFANMRISM